MTKGVATTFLAQSTRRYLLAAVAVFFASALSFHGITNHMFWDDEANTALYARNILSTGEFTAFDGTNAVGYNLGRELDEHLRPVYQPPLQFYSAAISMAVLGQTTFGGRALFVLLGLLAIFLVALWARQYLGDAHAWWLPALILALTPAYLLYIRQCRYYSMGVLFTFIVLLAFYAQGTTRRDQIVRFSIGIVAAVLLFLTNYIHAASALGALPIFFAFKRFHAKRHFIFLGAIYVAVSIAGLYILIMANPFSAHVTSPGVATGISRFFILLWWHLSGLTTFEFFPILVIPIIVMPFFIKGLKAQRHLAFHGMVLLCFMFVYILITCLFTPQEVYNMTSVADMRQVVPLIAIGTVVSAIALIILWYLWRPAAVIVGIIMCFSNLGHLAFMGNEGGARSTLLEYVRENFNNYTTSTEAMVDYLRTVPAGTSVQILPVYMTYPPMFYVPKLHYCYQLSVGKAIDPELRSTLPDYVFVQHGQPELVLAGSQHVPVEQVLAYFNQRFGFGSYRLETTIPIYWHEESRPDIPLHRFRPPSEELNNSQGIFVLRLNASH
jgi:4-amino-4-deoxy-L-arabinose transferase-like glycosyltransferase